MLYTYLVLMVFIFIFQLAVVQLAGAIASSVLVKEAGYFSHLLGPKFYATAGVRSMHSRKSLSHDRHGSLTIDMEWRQRLM